MRDRRPLRIRPARSGAGVTTTPCPRAAGTPRRILAAGLLAALLVTATAQAQDENPYTTVEGQATTSDLDTDVTPVAKETKLWTLLHGAEFPDTEVIDGSVTTFDTELHAVSFENRTIGLAGGSRCAIEPVQQTGEDDQAFARRARECRGTDGTQVPRVPAIYRYSEPPNQDPTWDRLTLPEPKAPGNAANAGYVGAITWIDSERALLVGGTGGYPERDRADDGRDPADPEKTDEAGEARAWIYARTSDELRELDLAAFTEPTTVDGAPRDGMRGFTAVDCYEDPRPEMGEKRVELCLAGALGQVWEFRDGTFNGRRIDALSDSRDLVDASLFRYRVRDIAFGGLEPPAAAAVTAGCCAADPSENTPRLLIYDGATVECDPNNLAQCNRTGPPRWYARSFYDRAGPVATVPESTQVCARPDQFPCSLGVPRTVDTPAGGGQQAVPPEVDNRRRELNDQPLLPDSLYSVTIPPSVNPGDARDIGPAVIFTPGGETSTERPSVITDTTFQPLGRQAFNPVPVQSDVTAANATTFSSARVVDGNGDFAAAGGSLNPDGVPDWTVGELGSTERSGLGVRGLVVATALKPPPQTGVNATVNVFGQGINPSGPTGVHRPTAEEIADGWEPIDQAKLDSAIRSQHFLLPSYSASSVQLLDGGGDGWIVGDRGAILRLSTSALNATQGAAEPKPPRLGAPRPKSLSDRDAYEDGRRELPAEAGSVPQIGGERIQLDEPEMVGMGSVGAVDEIVMSRDGSEGWAIGVAAGGGPSFIHYDGAGWSSCDPVGIPDQVEPDPECAEMALLRGYRSGNSGILRVRLTHAARVPLENDSDPSNDDDLEIVAVGERYRGPEYGGENLPTVVRYRDGRWRFEAVEAIEALHETIDTVRGENRTQAIDAITSLAFTAPDEGWLVARYNPVTGGTSVHASGAGARLYRFNGERWTDCQLQPAPCGDQARIPMMAREITGLTTAGDRVYMYGQRRGGGSQCPISLVCAERPVPVILYHDPGGDWTDGSGDGGDGGGFDPAFSDPGTPEGGRVDSLSVVEGPDGFEGWAVGEFGGVTNPSGTTRHFVSPQAALMRLDAESDGEWRRFRSPGVFEDYMIDYIRSGALGPRVPASHDRLQVAYPGSAGNGISFIGQTTGLASGGRVFAFDAVRGRFELLESGRPQGGGEQLGEAHPAGVLTAMAPDGDGGFWAAVSGYMFHYTDSPPKPVFEEVASPLGIRGVRLRALTGGPDGSVWLATDSDRLFRYDRLAGWEEVRIGWDPGRVVTRTSRATEIAVGPGGEGLVVGEEGRIAELSPAGVVLDAAAGRSCALGDAVPCGTSRDLLAVDVAPDGSAMAGGERLSLLWRPAGGEFGAIPKPPIGSSTGITAVSMPSPERAYLATSAGLVFRGDHAGAGAWHWEAENVTERGDRISVEELRDIAVDAAGHGYAVGATGILERRGDEEWHPLPRRFEGGTAVELPETGGDGVLIGDSHGQVLTGVSGELRVARPDDAIAGGEVIGFAYLPGSAAGSVDAWAGFSTFGEGAGRIVRHRSDASDPILEPTVAADALADAPPHRDGELSIAAFGKSDCDLSEADLCPEMSATTTTNDLISARIVDELAARRQAGTLDVAVQSGDATDSAGLPGSSLADLDRIGSFNGWVVQPTTRFLAGQLKHRRYAELVAEELEENGVPLFAAIGSQDLSETYGCASGPAVATFSDCFTTKATANAGDNLAWREGFAGRVDPWGDGSGTIAAGEPTAETSRLELEPAVGSEDNSLRIEDQSADADGEGAVPESKLGIGGASTHYAVDVLRDQEPIARLVFVDTSLRALQAADPQQQPHELGGGQTRFLERMICREGSITSFGDSCTREPGQKAVVVSNTPTYSYGLGALTHTALDGTTFEALMLRHDVDLVVSGALGYNGLYYTLAPGVHEPCPGGEYPGAPPSGRAPDCLGEPTGPAEAVTEKAPPEAQDPASLIDGQNLTGAYPTLIAAGAGGKLGPDGNDPPDGPAGQWHGYSLARLMPGGDIVVEQRPILDWIGIDAPDHALAPRSRLSLHGYGRSPISTPVEGGQGRAFHYEISNAAITHRYELLLADPERPTLPCRADDPGCAELHANLSEGKAETSNLCEPHLCLPDRIATVDDQTGRVRAGDGRYPETFAVATLSVADRVATYPLVFKRSPSFVIRPNLRVPGAPPINPAPTPTPPSQPAPPDAPQIPEVDVPAIPVPPGIPALTAAAPPEPQPPSPPAPPPPTQQPAALDLSVAPPGVSISTPTALIQPPTPPVNPAPPGGARKEARQRQAAAQKGGADSSEETSEAQKMGGDLAQGPHGAGEAMTRLESNATRRDVERAAGSYSVLASREQPSAWSRGLLYGGGLTLFAFALAAGWTRGRPTPRGRRPELPAPAWGRTGTRRPPYR